MVKSLGSDELWEHVTFVLNVIHLIVSLHKWTEIATLFNHQFTEFLKMKHSALPNQYKLAWHTTGSDPPESISVIYLIKLCNCGQVT